LVLLFGEHKVVLVHDLKGYGGTKVKQRPFLTSPMYEGEWSASSQGRFNPGEEILMPVQ
jgi:hypothetical protein